MSAHTIVARPRIWPVFLTLIALALCLAGGFWQLDREQQKLDLARKIREADAEPPRNLNDTREHLPSLLWHRVRMQGRYLEADTIFLDNRVNQGRAGYQVVTPFDLASRRQTLLIDRGWVPTGASREVLPDLPAPAGAVTVEGRLVPLPGKALELGATDARERVWLNLDLARYATRQLQPEAFLVQQSAPEEPGLVRSWPAPNFGTEKHRAYAMQWFGMALVALVFLVMFVVRRLRSTGPGTSGASHLTTSESANEHDSQKPDQH